MGIESCTSYCYKHTSKSNKKLKHYNSSNNPETKEIHRMLNEQMQNILLWSDHRCINCSLQKGHQHFKIACECSWCYTRSSHKCDKEQKKPLPPKVKSTDTVPFDSAFEKWKGCYLMPLGTGTESHLYTLGSKVERSCINTASGLEQSVTSTLRKIWGCDY